MAVATKYLHLLKRKRTWTPVAVAPGPLLAGGEDVIRRALALRCLEIPVGDFITDAMKGDLPQGVEAKGCKQLLLSNVRDEIKHDQALDFASAAHGISPKAEAEAQKIKAAWLGLDRHPILKALVLERSVFFVLLPIFRYLGDTGLRTTSQDVSRDETVHVCSNALVSEALGLKQDPELNNLRLNTISWVLQSLKGQADNRHLSKDFWLRCSNNLYETGKAPELSDTRASRQIAFFECSNVNLPMYA
jgi:hypothetical protein